MHCKYGSEAHKNQNAPSSAKCKCSHLQLEKIPFLTPSMERLHEWEILFPHGVICLSRSTLNGLPSPPSKSFLCVLALSTLSWFFPSLNAKQLFHTVYYAARLITAYLITLAFCISEIPFTSTQQWPYPLSHTSTRLKRASSGCWQGALLLFTTSHIPSTS